MHVTRHDDFEEPALEWLFREVGRLAAALRSAGLTGDDVRRVCHDFVSGLAYGLDSEPVDVDGVRYGINVIATRPDGHAVAATESFLFHEMANSIVDQVLDGS